MNQNEMLQVNQNMQFRKCRSSIYYGFFNKSVHTSEIRNVIQETTN